MGISLYSYYIRSKGKKKVTALFSLPSFAPVSTLRFLDPFFASTWPACLLVKCCFALISSSLRYLFDIFSLTIIVRNYKYTFGERKGREGKKRKRSGRDRWDGVLNRNRPPLLSPDKWPLSGTGASLRRDLDGDPLQMSGGEKREALWSTSWWSNFLAKSRSTRKRGWNRSGCVFFSALPTVKHQSSTDNNSPLKPISPSSKDKLSRLIFASGVPFI